jgi:hypothetical protein
VGAALLATEGAVEVTSVSRANRLTGEDPSALLAVAFSSVKAKRGTDGVSTSAILDDAVLDLPLHMRVDVDVEWGLDDDEERAEGHPVDGVTPDCKANTGNDRILQRM